ncbi:MAG: sigma-54 dependent transcriptional regulator [Acidobacteria bacterium]|nr:sigma-54 dependent transcriptional regulator [Acidobacteriota bacterium]MCA1610037.1 sigma-54 dependent transcriptional regulator [Acidobacteriota bacterium]
MAQKVLVVDDDSGIRDALRMILEYEGFEVLSAPDGKTALADLDGTRIDAVLLDIKMPGMDGFEILDRIVAREDAPPVLMISGHGDIATAIEATRRGAIDFLEKPPQRERILVSIRNALSRTSLRAENERLRQKLEEESVLVGRSAPMAQLRAEVARAAPTTATVLVVGESGTGKELVAREIHQGSRVASGPFVQVNCAAIPEELIESELFGHEKGSFTGAVRRQTGKFVEADGGTIFLDEIGDMSARAQAKVLRVLEAGEVEPVGAARVRQVTVRVIAATNRDLTEAIRDSRFREDLYFRLNVLPVRTPPLRERTDDIPELVEHFTRLFSQRDNQRPRRFAPSALSVLKARSWPGNVRELRNLIERVLIMTDSEPIEAKDLPPEARVSPTEISERGLQLATLSEFKEYAEREFLVTKLRENGWNISRTAEVIHTPRSNLYKKIEHHKISREKDAS